MTSTITPLAHGKRLPIPFTDEHGIACLSVPLDSQGKNFALIEREDYDHIALTLGCRAAWCLTGNGKGGRYVVVNPPQSADRNHGLISVARLFTGAGAKQFVRYATPDTTDLRRSNLVLTTGTGRARHDCGEWLSEAVQERSAPKREPAQEHQVVVEDYDELAPQAGDQRHPTALSPS